MKRFRVLPLLILLVSLAAIASADRSSVGITDEIDGAERELQDLRQQIDDARSRADALATDEEQQLARLHAIERETELTAELLEGLAVKEIGIRAQIDTLQSAMDDARARVHDRRRGMGQRLRAMYMRPRYSVLSMAMTSDSLGELTTRVRAMTHVARTERALIEHVEEAQAELRARRGELAAQMAEINMTRSETEDRKIQLQRALGERQEALLEVREERVSYEATLREMESAAQEMENLLQRLEERRRQSQQAPPSGTGFAERAGSLPWPVDGRVLKPFGRSVHPEFKTVVVNKGVNIGAPTGTPIRSVAAGTVEYVDWLPGYGKCIIVDHGEGYYTLYAHASAIFPTVGSQVQPGEVLGEVGDTGSLNGSQLYFEIRQGKTPLDPDTWLRAR